MTLDHPLSDRASTHRNNTQRILVVEDDPDVRMIEAAFLRTYGYHVDVAADGEAGWQMLNHAQYDLLITDHQMPRLSGMDLIWRLQAAHFTLPVVMTSGLQCVEIVNPSAEPAPWFKAFLRKPFRPRELIDIVRHVLDGTGRLAPQNEPALHAASVPVA